MNANDKRGEVDECVRRALQPDEAVVRRVLVRALGKREPRQWSRTAGRLLAAAVATILVGVGVWRWGLRAPSDVRAVTITGDRSLVVAEHPDGRQWMIAAPADRPLTGSIVIIVER